MNPSKQNKLSAILHLDIGDKIYAGLATWYSKKDWNRTIYGNAENLLGRYIEGVVIAKHVNKASKALTIKVKFPLMEEDKPKWFSSKELLKNPLYVMRKSKLPKQSFNCTFPNVRSLL